MKNNHLVTFTMLLLACGCNHWAELPPLPPRVTETADPRWPMYAGNPARTSAGAQLLLQGPPKLAWRRRLERQPGFSALLRAAVATEQRIFVLTSVRDLSGMQPGPQKFLITALRLQDGKQLWKREDPDLARTFRKAVAVDDGKLFLATDPGVKALECRSGKLLWHTKQKQIGEKTPNCLVVSDGRIIVSFKSGAVVAFTHSDGSILWKFPDATARLALYHNKVIFDHDLLPDYRLSARAVAVQSGQPLWQIELRSPPLWLGKKKLILDQFPMVSRGLVIICPEETSPTLYRNTLRTYVAALNAETGGTRWRSGLPSGAIQGMECDGKRVYVICYNGEIRGLSLATGRRLWKRRLRLSGLWAKPDVLGHVAFLPPVVSGRVLVVAGYGNELFGLSCESGEVLWKIRLEDRSIAGGTQLLVAGNRLVIAHDADVWAFKPAGTPGNSSRGEKRKR